MSFSIISGHHLLNVESDHLGSREILGFITEKQGRENAGRFVAFSFVSLYCKNGVWLLLLHKSSLFDTYVCSFHRK